MKKSALSAALSPADIICNASRVMTAAHSAAAETVAAFPGADYKATLSAALRIAWAGVRAEKSLAAVPAAVAADGGREFYSDCCRAFYGVKKDMVARGYIDGDRAEFLASNVKEDIINDAVARFLTAAAAGKHDKRGDIVPADRLLFRSMRSAFMAAWRQNFAHDSAVIDYVDDSGRVVETAIDTGLSVSAARAVDPAAAAEAADDIDYMINCVSPVYRDAARAWVNGHRAGYTDAEIAAAMGVSKFHISRARHILQLIRAELADGVTVKRGTSYCIK